MIYIPTNRKTVPLTWTQLPARLQEETLVVTPEPIPGVRCLVKPEWEGQGIGFLRQKILEYHTGPVLGMMDDDLVFKVRDEKGTRSATGEDVLLAVSTMRSIMETYARVGFSSSFHSGLAKGKEYGDNQPPNRAWFIRADIVKKENIRFDELQLCEDWHVCLSLLEKGYPSRTYYRWISHEKSHLPGGCQELRSGIGIEQQQKFAELHPETTSLILSKNPDYIRRWGGALQTRVYWKKAFKIGSGSNRHDGN